MFQAASPADFSLEYLSARMADFHPPEEPFDPRGDWRLTYGVYTFAAQQTTPIAGSRVGRLELSRGPGEEDLTRLTLRYEKIAPGGFNQVVEARMVCRRDALATPVRWEWSSRVLGPRGELLESSVVAKRATASNGRVEIIDDSGRRRMAAHGPMAINWALWEAVMRMPHAAGPPLAFTLLDHFDQLKPRHSLAYRTSTKAAFANRRTGGRAGDVPPADTREVALHAFDHLGEGIVPWVYWTDDHGRLLFVVAGLEVYLLERADEA